LIGLKVQSSSNDPERKHKDMADIDEIVRQRAASLEWPLIEDYFRLFGREPECRELRRKYP